MSELCLCSRQKRAENRQFCQKGSKVWMKHAHYASPWAPCSTKEGTTRVEANLPPLKSFSLWSHFDEHVGVSVHSSCFVFSVCQWQWMRWEIIYSLSRSFWLLSSDSPNISSAIKENVVVDFSTMMRWALIKRPLHNQSSFQFVHT